MICLPQARSSFGSNVYYLRLKNWLNHQGGKRLKNASARNETRAMTASETLNWHDIFLYSAKWTPKLVNKFTGPPENFEMCFINPPIKGLHFRPRCHFYSRGRLPHQHIRKFFAWYLCDHEIALRFPASLFRRIQTLLNDT